MIFAFFEHPFAVEQTRCRASHVEIYPHTADDSECLISNAVEVVVFVGVGLY